MNENLVEIIKQYLKIETNYAVIINGGYGIGKTHFFKHLLSKEIEIISTPRNEQKKYHPIHISLFGINTVEEVQSQIFLALYPILKNKGLKLAAGLGKSIIRGFAQFNHLGDIDKYIADINVSAKEWINYDELVLCFDDLDRKSNNLNIKDILGFINTLVENYGAKIIIIANEKTLLKDTEYTTELREKVIGVSIQFEPDINNIFDLIISERYSSSDKLYFKFLLDNKKQIIEAIEKNDNNLRNLIFFLEHFKIIFYPLLQLFADVEFKIQKEEKLEIVLSFTLAIAIEYKIGKLNSSNFKDIQQLNEFDIDTLAFILSKQTGTQEKREKTYSEEFKEKYFSNINFIYLNSIFNYIIGKSAFRINELKKELNKIFIVENGKIPETQKIINKLAYFDCLDLSYKEYKKETYKMLKFVDVGKFQLFDYPTVFHFATRFDNVLRFNIDKLKTRFKKGIKKGINNYKYDNFLRFKIAVDNNMEFKEELSDIMNYCIAINNEIKTKKEKNDLEYLENLFEVDFLKFLEKVKEPNNEYRFSPFWLNFSLNKIYKVINRLSNKEIIELSFYFQDRYKINIYEKLYPEKDFLINLKNKINYPQKRKIKNLRNATLDFLIKHMQACIDNFPT